MFVFGVGDFCKLLLGMGLRNFGFLCCSKIVPTGFMSFFGGSIGQLLRYNRFS